MLDTNGGIGVIDVGASSSGEPGLLAPSDIDHLFETMHYRSKEQSRMATGAAANNLDLYHVNCTFYDALGRRDNEDLIVFFTSVAAVVGPLAMGAISDRFGSPKFGFVLATVFAAMLFGGFLLNRIFDPAPDRLPRLDHSEYESAETQAVGAQARS